MDSTTVLHCVQSGDAPLTVTWREAVAPGSGSKSEVIPWLNRVLRAGDTCETVAEGLGPVFEAWIAGERKTFITALCTHTGDAAVPPVVRWAETETFRSETTLPDEIVPLLGRPLRTGELCGGEIGEMLRDMAQRWLDRESHKLVLAACVWRGPNAIPRLNWSVWRAGSQPPSSR